MQTIVLIVFILDSSVLSNYTVHLFLYFQLASKNVSTGVVSIALSRDSTCKHGLHSSKHGYETFVMTPRLENPWPSIVRKSSCIFPAWMEGEWNDVSIRGNKMIYKDRHQHRTTYTSLCVQQSFRHKNRYLVYSRTQWYEQIL